MVKESPRKAVENPKKSFKKNCQNYFDCVADDFRKTFFSKKLVGGPFFFKIRVVGALLVLRKVPKKRKPHPKKISKKKDKKVGEKIYHFFVGFSKYVWWGPCLYRRPVYRKVGKSFGNIFIFGYGKRERAPW